MNLNLTNVNEVPADLLIEILASKLKDENIVTPPEWSNFVKTGSHAERPPQSDDWWYVRCASLLRKVYLHGPIGLSVRRILNLQKDINEKQVNQQSENHYSN